MQRQADTFLTLVLMSQKQHFFITQKANQMARYNRNGIFWGAK